MMEVPTASPNIVRHEDGRLSLDLPKVGWNGESGVVLVGGLLLLVLGLLRSWVFTIGVSLPAVLFWAPPILGVFLVWRGLSRSFVATRIELARSESVVERRLGPFRSFSRIDVKSLRIEGARDNDGVGDLRLSFDTPGGVVRQRRVLRLRTSVEREQVASALITWLEPQPGRK